MQVLSQFEKKAQFEAELQRYEEQADFLYRKQRLERIEYFQDQYEFLANEYPCPVFYEGIMYQSVYAAFQAARSTEEETRQRIAASVSVLEVFQIAQHIDDPKDWNQVRLRVMEILLRDKYRRNGDLRERLRATSHYQLINTTQGASASNLFWGIVDGKGQNQLGRLLEEIRADIETTDDVEKWVMMSFKLEREKNLTPILKLFVDKDGEHIETITLQEKSFYGLGQQKRQNDVLLAHPSVSRRHCLIFISENSTVQIVDLGSRSGTFVNDQVIESHLPFPLVNDDKIKFAKSSRVYSIDINYDDAKEYLSRKIRNLESRVYLLDKVQSGKASSEELKASLGLQKEDVVQVNGLPDKVSHFELKQLFSKKGKVLEMKIPTDKSTGNTKNIAFFKFENERDAKWYVEKQKLDYKGQKLKLSLATTTTIDQFYEELRWGTEVMITKPSKSKSKSRSRSRSHKKHKKRKH